MNQRDQFHRGQGRRGEQHGGERGEQQGNAPRSGRGGMQGASRDSDTWNPDPQWLQEDRQRRGTQGRDDEYDHGRGRDMASDRFEQSGRGSYAGSGREWGESTGHNWAGRDVSDQERAQYGNPRRGGGGQQYGSQFGGGSGPYPGGGYDNAYGGSGRDVEQYGGDQRGWDERGGQRGFSRGGRGGQPPGGQHDHSTGYEAAQWDDQDFGSESRTYAPFRVGTGMGVGTSGYGRQGYGSSYGNASGYGGPSGGFGSSYGGGGYGASGFEDEASRHMSAGSHRGGSQYGSRGGWDLGTHQRDFDRDAQGRSEQGRSEEGRSEQGRSFRGLGPQNYKRPDERIRDDVYERLTDSHAIDARYILVDVNQGNVSLTGTVTERRMRYAAEDLLEDVMGVANINNQLKVQDPASKQGAGAAAGESQSGASSSTENKRH